jgi:hypothetical protein
MLCYLPNEAMIQKGKKVLRVWNTAIQTQKGYIMGTLHTIDFYLAIHAKVFDSKPWLANQLKTICIINIITIMFSLLLL